MARLRRAYTVAWHVVIRTSKRFVVSQTSFDVHKTIRRRLRHCNPVAVDLGPDLQNILRQSYDYLAIMPNLRSTYDGRLIYKTSYEERKAFHTYDLVAKS